jgi:CRP-like cAMP-binding protein
LNNLTPMPIEFHELREKLTAELLNIGRNSQIRKRTISMSGMAQMMGISKETVFALLESLEQGDDITMDHQRILIKIKPE